MKRTYGSPVNETTLNEIKPQIVESTQPIQNVESTQSVKTVVPTQPRQVVKRKSPKEVISGVVKVLVSILIIGIVWGGLKSFIDKNHPDTIETSVTTDWGETTLYTESESNQTDMTFSANNTSDDVNTTMESNTSQDRKSLDDSTMVEWITPALTFNSVDEYTDHRAIYVDRLGADSDFVTNFMPSISNDQFDSNMSIGSFESQLIDTYDDDVCTYIAYIEVSRNSSDGYDSSSEITVLYTMDAEQNVLSVVARSGRIDGSDMMLIVESNETTESVNETTETSIENTTQDRTVYVSSSGKYHLDSDCSGMKSYTTMSLSEAQANGYESCKKCAQ